MTQQDFDIDAFQRQVLKDVARIRAEERRRILEEEVVEARTWSRQSDEESSPQNIRAVFIGLVLFLVALFILWSMMKPQPPISNPFPTPEYSPYIFPTIIVFAFVITVVSGGVLIHINVRERRQKREREEQARLLYEREEQARRRLDLTLSKLNQAEEITQTPNFRAIVCPALQSITNDVFEYSKILTPILVGAVLAKTIVMPLDTLLFAAIAVVVSRSGVSSICANYPGKK